ncbi:MAG TPA: hypothetical protein DCR93_10485 [Cytophagales bacterium]|nr:hypothetical protein [Cytophagales bacterium]HAP59899.1 hypothetical protein [Cytophagales bacterium]
MSNSLLNTGSDHFDPFCLSIYESANDAQEWRKRIENIKHKINIKSDEVSLQDLQSQLTSIHEQDHFLRYSSSEIGLLLTFISQLNCQLRFQYLKHEQDFSSRGLSLYKILLESLYGNSDITQEEAVWAFNVFFKKFSHANKEIFFTKNPKAKATPEPFFGLNNILEASAVLTEMSFLETLDPELRNNNYNQFLHLNNRDKDLYFGIIAYMHPMVFYTSAMNSIVLFSLDVRVPFFGSPFIEPIDWEDFHPGYRLIFFTKSLAHHFSSVGYKDDWSRDPSIVYNYDFQKRIIDKLKYLGDEVGLYKMWDSPELKSYPISTLQFVNRLNSKGRQLVEPSLSLWKPVFDHLFDSFQKMKDMKEKYHVAYFTNHARFHSENIAAIPNLELDNYPYALFSNFNGKIDSYYDFVDKKLDIVLDRYFFNLVMQGYLKKIKKRRLKSHLIKNFHFGYQDKTNILKPLIDRNINIFY